MALRAQSCNDRRAVVMQDDLGYQQARNVWNADIDQRALGGIVLWFAIPFDSPYGEGTRHNLMARITTIDAKRSRQNEC